MLALAGTAHAQHLWWHPVKGEKATCAYGEITVLSTYPSIYYCGVNWHPGEPAGGYCGIQDNSFTQKCTIFSIWDTSPQLHPTVTEADPHTRVRRFGGEGTGGHTDMLMNWNVGETFRYIVTKQPSQTPGTTDTKYYIFDRDTNRWRHIATINNPNGGHDEVGTIAGGLNSFLENYAGRDRDVPRLATYRLWVGTSAQEMKCVTNVEGDGPWGELNGCYFLATGDRAKLDAVLATLEPKYGKAVFGGNRVKLPPIPSGQIPEDVVETINLPPHAPVVVPGASPTLR